MTASKPFFGIVLGAALVGLAACTAPDETNAPPPAEPVSLDPDGLHAVLIEEADTIVPSIWQTGEPAPETALAFWHVPPTLDDIIATSDCTALDEVNTYDCTLTLRAPNYDADEDERRDVEALFRFNVRDNEDGTFTLLDPAVRWAVRDAE
ncbi:hypothetical protein [Hyphobacterium sp.]|uniref:hypothetical protein n=1 Tax=Hyphobacterium sp. TaxID=2004662 RepID=UPI003BAD4EE3